MVAVHRVAFIHFYSMTDVKYFYETYKNFDNGKVQAVPALDNKNKAIEYKSDEDDDENMGMEPTSIIEINGIHDQQV